MRKYKVYGLGAGIMDILVHLDEEEFESLGLKKGSMTLVDDERQSELLYRFSSGEPKMVSGGSAANTVIALAQLGTPAAYGCRLSSDRFGTHYGNEFRELGIELTGKLLETGATGTSLILITPDAERTMNTCLGVSAQFCVDDVREDIIRDSEWIYIEGYLLANGENAQRAVFKALEDAERHKTKVAFTFSDGFIVNAFADEVRKVVEQSDLVFANEDEAKAFTGADSAENAFSSLKESCKDIAMTAGPRGAFVRFGDYEGHTPGFECTPKDVTGAGDMFAGAFLHGVVTGTPIEKTARGACFMAMNVITGIGARLTKDSKPLWNEAIS